MNAPALTILLEWLMFLVLSVWIHQFTLNRAIMVGKFQRLHEVEEHFDVVKDGKKPGRLLDQHRRFRIEERRQRDELRVAGGVTTQIFLYYFLVALGVVVALYSQLPRLARFQVGTRLGLDRWLLHVRLTWTWWNWLRLVISILPMFIAIRRGARMKAWISTLQQKEGYRLRYGTYRLWRLHHLWLRLGGYTEDPHI